MTISSNNASSFGWLAGVRQAMHLGQLKLLPRAFLAFPGIHQKRKHLAIVLFAPSIPIYPTITLL